MGGLMSTRDELFAIATKLVPLAVQPSSPAAVPHAAKPTMVLPSGSAEATLKVGFGLPEGLLLRFADPKSYVYTRKPLLVLPPG